MRTARGKASKGAEAGFYQCVSRIVHQEFLIKELEKEKFVELMDAYAEFSGIQIVTFCCMTNHVHLPARVPRRPSRANLPNDEELVRLVSLLNNKGEPKDLETMLK